MNEIKDNANMMQLQGDGLEDHDRREALKKLGKCAVYTTPVMLALLLPKKCLAQCSGDDCKPEP